MEHRRPRLIDGLIDRAQRRSREWQAERARLTGFVAHPEIGHAVVDALRRRGFPRTTALVGGHLAAVGGEYNWQGNARIAFLMRASKRTIQRARLVLEREKLITSNLLLTGDQLEGQRAPVRHPQVIRHVARLQRLARVHDGRGIDAAQHHPKKRRKPSAAEYHPPPDAPRATADELAELARERPEFAEFFGGLAEAAAKAPWAPSDAAPPPPPSVIDEWERETERREREQRGPPE